MHEVNQLEVVRNFCSNGNGHAGSDRVANQDTIHEAPDEKHQLRNSRYSMSYSMYRNSYQDVSDLCGVFVVGNAFSLNLVLFFFVSRTSSSFSPSSICLLLQRNALPGIDIRLKQACSQKCIRYPCKCSDRSKINGYRGQSRSEDYRRNSTERNSSVA